MTHHITSCDVFIAGPQIDEWETSYPEIDLVKTVESETWTLRLVAYWFVAALCAVLRMGFVLVFRIARTIRWASQPPKKRIQKTAHPGLSLEFVVFGLAVIGTLSLVL
jgi:hypothetical protein